MALIIRRRSDHEYLPHRYQDGTFRVHARHGGAERNRADHATKLNNLTDVAHAVESGNFVLRMSPGGDSAPINLISPEDIEIIY